MVNIIIAQVVKQNVVKAEKSVFLENMMNQLKYNVEVKINMYTKLKQLIAATLSVVHIGSGTRKRK